jgi:hypothetical protein
MSGPEHRIPPPSDDKPPLKANLFDKLQATNTQLMPLFPYLDRGAIVPAASLMRGGTGAGFADFGGGHAEFGNFFHYNDADEVALTWATDGGTRAAGLIRCLPNHHGVQPHLREPNDPNCFSIVVITQRQADTGAQREAVEFRCRQCRQPLVHHEYDATPPATPREAAPEAEPYPALPSILGSAAAAEAYNASEAARPCPKCGTVNPPFPLEQWGWSVHAQNSRIVNAGRRMLDAAAGGDA